MHLFECLYLAQLLKPKLLIEQPLRWFISHVYLGYEAFQIVHL